MNHVIYHKGCNFVVQNPTVEDIDTPQWKRYMTITADSLIAEYGSQAYHKAVEFTVIANMLNDKVGAQAYADAGIELMKRGYHKNEKDGPTVAQG